MLGGVALDVDADEGALLEWVGLLSSMGVMPRHITKLSELADGEELLRVMRDLAPDLFCAPDNCGGQCLVPLLEGLEQHLRDCGGSGGAVQELVQQSRANRPVDPARLARLALVATVVDNDSERRRFYIEVMMMMSPEGQATAKALVGQFLERGGIASPQTGFLQPRDDSSTFGATPASQRGLALRQSSAGGLDWREPGLDIETRFKALREEYNLTMEEHERVLDECQTLGDQLQEERKRRREAEESGRHAKASLRDAEKAADRAAERSRHAADSLHEQKMADLVSRFKQREEELDAAREDLALVRQRAATAEKLQKQIESYKHKLEAMQSVRHDNDELRKQLDDSLSRPGAGASGGHLQRSLERARDDARTATRERAELQQQLLTAKDELEREQALRSAADRELQMLRRGVSCIQQPGAAADSAQEYQGDGGAGGKSINIRAEVSATRNASAMAPSIPSTMSPRAQGDLLERLLFEKERATKAETNLETKAAEAAALADRAGRDRARISELEVELATARRGAGDGGGEGGDQRARQLQSQLDCKDQQLHVFRLREAGERDCLASQHTFMAGCFHQVGLEFQKMRMRAELAESRQRSRC